MKRHKVFVSGLSDEQVKWLEDERNRRTMTKSALIRLMIDKERAKEKQE